MMGGGKRKGGGRGKSPYRLASDVYSDRLYDFTDMTAARQNEAMSQRIKDAMSQSGAKKRAAKKAASANTVGKNTVSPGRRGKPSP